MLYIWGVPPPTEVLVGKTRVVGVKTTVDGEKGLCPLKVIRNPLTVSLIVLVLGYFLRPPVPRSF